MRVIKSGNVAKAIRATCQYCKCVFEFDKSEGQTTNDQREGHAVSIGCPECGKPVWHQLDGGNESQWER